MNKELFIKTILAIQSQINHDVFVSEKLADAFPGNYSANLLPDNHWIMDSIVENLKDVMHDTDTCSDGYGWIEYFCWELNFGAENYRLKAYDSDGVEIPLTTPEDLWELLSRKINN